MNLIQFIVKSINRRLINLYAKPEVKDSSDRILEVKNEEAESEIAVQNMQLKLKTKGIKVIVPNEIKEHAVDLEFTPIEDAITQIKEEETATGLVIESTVKKTLKTKKKVRKITYTLKTKQGETLYKGRKLRIFMKHTGLDKKFSFSAAYHFAQRYQGSKLFKDGYYISFTENK